jgi:hypothetical protein
MNQYGRRAQRYWQSNLPRQYAQIPDPETFFDRMGQTMAGQIDELAEQIAGPDPAGEGYLDKVGRLSRARSEAEMQITRETLPPPESAPPESAPPESEPSEDQPDTA